MRRDIYEGPYEGQPIIDSRDVIKRLADLIDERDAATEDAPFDEDDAEELARLQALAADGETSPDWHHGETLIADSYFEDYARELANDIGAIDRNAGWPTAHIDWKAAADALKVDYFSVEYGDTTYWIRG